MKDFFLKLISLLPPAALLEMLLEILVRFPDNHSASPYFYLPIFVTSVLICGMVSIVYGRVPWGALLCCCLGIVMVIVCDIFNIWVDYNVWCARGLPSWGILGTKGFSQAWLFGGTGISGILIAVLWMTMLIGMKCLPAVQTKIRERVGHGMWRREVCYWARILPVAIWLEMLLTMAGITPHGWVCSPYKYVVFHMMAISSVVIMSKIVKKILLAPLLFGVLGIAFVIVCDVFNVWVEDSVLLERGSPNAWTFGTFGCSQILLVGSPWGTLKSILALWMVLRIFLAFAQKIKGSWRRYVGK